MDRKTEKRLIPTALQNVGMVSGIIIVLSFLAIALAVATLFTVGVKLGISTVWIFAGLFCLIPYIGWMVYILGGFIVSLVLIIPYVLTMILMTLGSIIVIVCALAMSIFSICLASRMIKTCKDVGCSTALPRTAMIVSTIATVLIGIISLAVIIALFFGFILDVICVVSALVGLLFMLGLSMSA